MVSDPQSSGLSSLRAALNLEGAADAGQLRRRTPPAGYGGFLLSPAHCLIVRPYADSSLNLRCFSGAQVTKKLILWGKRGIDDWFFFYRGQIKFQTFC